MSSVTGFPSTPLQDRTVDLSGPRLAGTWQKIAVTTWAVVFLVSLLSCALSLAAINIWDRVPAAELPRYFSTMDQASIADKSSFQSEILSMGFSLAGFAFLLTFFRAAGSVVLFLLSALMVRRFAGRLIAVLFAVLLAVMGASGVWNNPLFPWASALAPWMEFPNQVLNLLLWMGVVMLYTFPEGRFTPRWTVILAILLIPLALSIAFDLQIFFNPNTWPDPLPFLPNLLFIGTAFFSVLLRYSRADLARKGQISSYTLGISLLLVLYFILDGLDFISTVKGAPLFQGNPAAILFTLVSEPLWFTLEIVFAILVGRSFFQKRMLQE